jgi:hypothetical protein
LLSELAHLHELCPAAPLRLLLKDVNRN